MILSLEEQEAKAARFREAQKEKESQKHQRKFARETASAQARRQRGRNQARLVALEAAQGLTVDAIARKYRITPHTVRQKLRHADRYHLLEGYTSATINKLVPQALAVYELTMSDLYHEVNKQVIDVATRVLEGTGVIGRDKAAQISQPNPPSEGDVTTIEEYRALRIRRMTAETQETADESTKHGIAGRGAVLDAHPEDPGGDVYRVQPELPGDRDGGSQDPAGGHPQDQGCGG